MQQGDPSSPVALGEAFSRASNIFMRLQRRITAAETAYRDAMTELLRLQSAAPEPEIDRPGLPAMASSFTPPDELPDAFPPAIVSEPPPPVTGA